MTKRGNRREQRKRDERRRERERSATHTHTSTNAFSRRQANTHTHEHERTHAHACTHNCESGENALNTNIILLNTQSGAANTKMKHKKVMYINI